MRLLFINYNEEILKIASDIDCESKNISKPFYSSPKDFINQLTSNLKTDQIANIFKCYSTISYGKGWHGGEPIAINNMSIQEATEIIISKKNEILKNDFKIINGPNRVIRIEYPTIIFFIENGYFEGLGGE